ncbi:alpha/beta fold hydrolase [Nocardia cyriacigeorgica]|uniref:alpha/beta fold hydrolase n=3 Tax=Nocardia cyriacigeorgica TaxID=135487 RepID=UPI002B4B136A|nr:alpha/beta fold hydrolase [Nocardia cyriacigeorgica]
MTNPDIGVEAGRTARVGDRDIYYTESGSGPVVVLLHGGGPGASGMSNYARNVASLAGRFRVIVADMPGYGRSTKRIDQSDPFGDLAAAVGGLLDVLDVPSAHLVGNSYGGAAALRLAMDRPEKVDRLILMGPGGVGTTRALPTKGLQTLLAYYGGAGPSREKLATFLREYLVYDASAITDDMIDRRYRDSIDPEVVANPPLRRPSGPTALRTLWRMDFTRDARLATANHPTLVVWGEADQVNRPAGARMLAERMPNCDVYMAARTGHWVQWERADLFNELAAAFLGESR